MRSAFVTGLSAIGFFLCGWALPIVYPKVDPFIAKSAFIVSLILLVIAFILWVFGEVSKEKFKGDKALSGDDDKDRPTFNQTHTGSGHNIGIGKIDNVHFGSPKIEMSEQLISEIAEKLDKSRPVSVIWRDKKRGPEMAENLMNGLSKRGFVIGSTVSFFDITGVYFDKPITVSMDGFSFGGMTLVGGQQAVAIETDF